MKPDHGFRNASLSLVWLWLFFFAVLPCALVMIASLMGHSESKLIQAPLTLENYQALSRPLYLHIFQKSFLIAGTTTFLCLVLGYPFAYLIARMQSAWKHFLILLVIIPFWTSSLIRSYALIALIKAKGILNAVLFGLGILHQPLSILFTNTAVILGLVYNLLPFMILPLITTIERLDMRLIDAAYDLGANRFTTFQKIILPLTIPGIISGSILVFLPAMTLFYISDILGGAKSTLVGNLIQNQFLITQNWPLGSAISIMLTLILVALILMYRWTARSNKQQEWL